MENLLTRHRNVTILVAVLFAEVIGLAVQVKRNTDTESSRLIRVWTVSAVSPLEKAFVATQQGISGIWHSYFDLRGVRAQNRKLEGEIEQLRLQQVRLAEDASQARRLQRLLGFKEQFIAKTVAAQVIGSSGSDMSRVVYIDKGASDGIKQDMAVITADGVVGKVLRVFSSSSQVLLINDPSSGVGAILEKSRLQGVIKGTPNGELVLEKMMSDEQVETGDQLLTSGGDQIFPKGLSIGTVKSVSPGRDIFLNIRVKPAARLSRLEEVLIITQVVERQPTAEEAQASMRAADILAARLPSVPENTGIPATGIPLPAGVKPQPAKAAGEKAAGGSAGKGSTLKPNSRTAGAADTELANSSSPKMKASTSASAPAGSKPASASTNLSGVAAAKSTKPKKAMDSAAGQIPSNPAGKQAGESEKEASGPAENLTPAPKSAVPATRKASPQPNPAAPNGPSAETPQP
ncbi:MAG TPA: rod shape-determining protein MreC [Terriglobales bacterium]|nr:rod shape-determining protein MreC [Terriglobales bacterium]